MSILIKGMEMPKGCDSCKFAERMNVLGEPLIISCMINDAITHEESWQELCPLVPVPPHGRLIDKDDALKVCDNLIARIANEYARDAVAWAKDCISVLPTIIPAEEGET